ncbi:MAG: hypothetical protein IJK02_06780 [Clostridia bacterium]|nr:hypothetical protein [Clostridia bacterium]
MFAKKILAFFLALATVFTGGAAAVVGTTPAEPITATERTYNFDRDKLLLGAYCFSHNDSYETLRQWFKEAGLNFYIGCWGSQYTAEELSWLDENGIGIFAPNTAYYHEATNDCIWGIDYRDEPGALDFETLAAGVAAEYEANPNRLPLVNLFPMYASDEQLGGNLAGRAPELLRQPARPVQQRIDPVPDARFRLYRGV